ncbi:hypothetical protein B0H19DRAFT_1297566 [Mycena capillaripes]|nr:hypothetical protein B0H19DRAFT_1297566 [Mycena capillaripes]
MRASDPSRFSSNERTRCIAQPASGGITFLKAVIAAIPNGTQQLDAIEIGNEPDLYPKFPSSSCGLTDRAPGYGPDNYSVEWTAAAQSKNIGNQVNQLGAETAWYQAMTFSSGVNQSIFNVTETWKALNDKFVKTVSQHYYQANACGPLKGTVSSLSHQLMDHSKTVSEMQSRFGAAVSFLKGKGTPFILGEVGSAIGARDCTPNPELYGSLGDALWTADFMLHSMSMGINSVSMQQGTNFNISAWQPVTTPGEPKAVHGNWYGHVFAADFIGAGGEFQIRPMPIKASHPNIVSYAGYNSGLLTRFAVLDMSFWNGNDTAGRPAVNIELAKLDAGITGVRVSRLTAPGGSSSFDGISWAGKQWTADNDGKEPQGNNSVVVKVTNQSLAGNVTILASQAILLEMIRA